MCLEIIYPIGYNILSLSLSLGCIDSVEWNSGMAVWWIIIEDPVPSTAVVMALLLATSVRN